MSFNTITIGTYVFNSVGDGRYMLSTVGLGDPQNGWRITPGKQVSGNAPTTASIQRFWEVDVTVSGVTKRKRASITVNFSIPSGVTATDIDGYLTGISDFISASTVTRILLGES